MATGARAFERVSLPQSLRSGFLIQGEVMNPVAVGHLFALVNVPLGDEHHPRALVYPHRVRAARMVEEQSGRVNAGADVQQRDLFSGFDFTFDL